MSTKPWHSCGPAVSSLQLAGTGVFGGNRPHTLWVGVERHPDLILLHDKIELALIRTGLAPEPRRFAPHVTLARLRDPVLDALGHFLAVHAQFRAAPLPVEQFSLIASFPTKAGRGIRGPGRLSAGRVIAAHQNRGVIRRTVAELGKPAT